jgi:hypothetical protein
MYGLSAEFNQRLQKVYGYGMAIPVPYGMAIPVPNQSYGYDKLNKVVEQLNSEILNPKRLLGVITLRRAC